MFCTQGNGQQGSRGWQWAMQYCADLGQWLVRVESPEENRFIYEHLNAMGGSGDAWMAATDRDEEGEWYWATSEDEDDWIAFYDGDDEEAVDESFVDWGDGEPDNTPGDGGADCGAFEHQGDDEWAWADRNCGASYARVVCEGAD
jgi:hypothetical protein